MRRGTLVTIVVLLALLALATVYQVLAAQGPRRYPGPRGPGVTSTPAATASRG